MSLYIVTPPNMEPVSLAEARAHCKLDVTDDDALLAGYIMASREMLEHEIQRALIARTYEYTLDEFPSGDDAIELPMGPIPASGAMSVTSVKYTDSADVEQTVSGSAYTVDAYSNVPRVQPVAGWPTPKQAINAVRVRYVSGHPDASLIPANLKTWILLQVEHFNANRASTAAGTIQALPFVGRLLDAYRSYR